MQFRSSIPMWKDLRQLCAGAALAAAFAFSLPALGQTTISEESFDNGLGSYTASGRVYTGSYGVRLRGGAASSITSAPINLDGYSGIAVSYDRQSSGLDFSESFTVAYSTNGGGYTALESTRTASGRATYNLPQSVEGQTIQLRFSLSASSFFETFVVDNIVVEGTGDGGGCEGPDCCPPNCGGGSLPPVDSVDTNGPFQTTQDRSAGPAGDAWVVHPTNLGANGLQHPIFIWGPGGGTGPSDYDWFLDRLASHGFVVYADVSSGNGGEMEDALDWLIAENSRPGSTYYQKLDTANIAAGGHSLGSVSTFAIADDPRLKTTIHVAGGSFDCNGPDNLRKPALYIGGTEDFATPNMECDYDVTDVPVFFTILDGVDHIYATRQGQPAIVAWLRWFIGGETFRQDDFISPACDFCTGIYDSQYKNW